MAATERSRCELGEAKRRPAASDKPARSVVFFKASKPTLFVQFEILLAPPVLLLQDFHFLPTLCRSLTSEAPPALGRRSLRPLNTTRRRPLILIKKDWRTITQARKTFLFGNSPQSSCCSPKRTYTVHKDLNLS